MSAARGRSRSEIKTPFDYLTANRRGGPLKVFVCLLPLFEVIDLAKKWTPGLKLAVFGDSEPLNKV
jgi:hypothetical protein